jgi:KDO2-lipid IV(A) lauroyltransferase
MDNLAIAFPEKSEKEKIVIMKEFYKNFIDNFIETIKLFSMSAKELKKRFVGNFEVINDLYDTGKKVQLHTGHFFNWEIANAGYSQNIVYPLYAVYMPIQNKMFDKVFINMRARFGSILVPATEYNKKYRTFANTQFCLALLADQNPGRPETAYWTPFFGKMVPIVKGPERGAKVADTAIVMCNFYKIKRGYYRSEMELLTTEPRSLPHGEITKKMVAFVEDAIRKHPANYLWSHRRWKWIFDEEKHGKFAV